MKHKFSITLSLVFVMIVSLTATSSALANAQTQLVSINMDGTEVSDGNSSNPRFSADGRFVAFESTSGNLVANDTNGVDDVFVRDLQTGITTLVSVNPSGNSSNSETIGPVISADGQHVAFMSRSTDLVSNFMAVDDDIYNVFVRDSVNGTTALVSDGIAAGLNSAETTSYPWALSADGQFVLFTSFASDLVSNDTNNTNDIFVRDLQSGTTTLVSVNLAGTNSGNYGSGWWPAMSDDGRFVIFTSAASDLVSNDTNNAADVFLRDLQTGTTTLVSVNNDGTVSANGASSLPTVSLPMVSADGRFVAFQSDASDLVSNDTNGSSDAFVRDLQTGTTTLVTAKPDGSNGNGSSIITAISADGRFVAFQSDASDLVSNDTNGTYDAFIRDLQTGTITLVSVNIDGTNSANGISEGKGISADGRFVIFESNATDLVSNIIDTNESFDIFVRDLEAGTTTLVNVNSDGTDIASGSIFGATISASGQFVAFHSFDSNLVSIPDMNEAIDIFVREVGGANPPQDTTAPTIALTTPTEGASYLLGQAVNADYLCQDEAGGSGLASCVGSVANGSPIDTSSVGAKSFIVGATDNAGNQASLTRNYNVIFNFSGFFQPVDNLPTMNVIRAGKGVAVRFSLSGDQGLNIMAPGYPTSQKMDCGSGTSLDDIEQTLTVGNSTLTYDAATDAYTYVWKTDSSWKGTCRTLVVRLSDGTEHKANFKFK